MTTGYTYVILAVGAVGAGLFLRPVQKRRPSFPSHWTPRAIARASSVNTNVRVGRIAAASRSGTSGVGGVARGSGR